MQRVDCIMRQIILPFHHQTFIRVIQSKGMSSNHNLEMHTKFQMGNPKEKHNKQHLDTGARIILKCI
jgi:hypothetical protein